MRSTFVNGPIASLVRRPRLQCKRHESSVDRIPLPPWNLSQKSKISFLLIEDLNGLELAFSQSLLNLGVGQK